MKRRAFLAGSLGAIAAGCGGAVPRWPPRPIPPEPEPPPAEPTPPTRVGPPIWGNFLAAPGFSLDGPGETPGLMYGAMLPEERKRFRDVYRAHGWRTLPIHPQQTYRHWAYDYSKDLPAYRDVLHEAIAEGLEPLGMVMNWRPEGWTLDQARRYIDETLPKLMDLYTNVCFGWESNDISEVGVSEDTLILQHQIRQIVGPDKPTWLHVAPRWWSPTPRALDSMDEWAYWRAVGDNCDGLLLQLDFHDTDEHARFVTFDMYPIAGTAGLAGRLVEALHKKCAVFEFARTWTEWQRLHTALDTHPKAHLLEGYC